MVREGDPSLLAVDDYEPEVDYDPREGVLGLGVVMVRRLFASIFLAAFPVVVIPIAVTSMGAQAGAAPPTAVQQCKDGGWQTLTDASGQPFRNQGRCIHNPISLADLTGSFSGTTSWTIGTGGCSFVQQVFEATYPGTSAVGSVTLHLDGCADIIPSPWTYTGTFAITTSVGTLAGKVAGLLLNVVNSFPTDWELTLTVVSGSGAFAVTTGAIHVSIQWIGGGTPGIPTPMTGSVTFP
jgi:hypothetical protein